MTQDRHTHDRRAARGLAGMVALASQRAPDQPDRAEARGAGCNSAGEEPGGRPKILGRHAPPDKRRAVSRVPSRMYWWGAASQIASSDSSTGLRRSQCRPFPTGMIDRFGRIFKFPHRARKRYSDRPREKSTPDFSRGGGGARKEVKRIPIRCPRASQVFVASTATE